MFALRANQKPDHDFESEFLITNVLRGVASQDELAQFNKRASSDPGFQALIEEVKHWLQPVEPKELSPKLQDEMLGAILTAIDKEDDRSG